MEEGVVTNTNELVWPDPMSVPCRRFVKSHLDLIGYLTLAADLATHVDEAAERAKPALRKYYTARGDDAALAALDEERPSAQAKLRELGGFAFEMALSHSVDNYVTYLAELLGVVFQTRPETMRSAEQVTYEFILDNSGSIEELLNALADRRVYRLSRSGLEALAKDLNDRLGLKLFDRERDMRDAVRAVEMRNLIVHNRGVIDRHYASRFGLSQALVASHSPLSPRM